ncbi:MAG: hypothetical protein ACUVWR_00855 [Anaerolineae bacterium]
MPPRSTASFPRPLRYLLAAVAWLANTAAAVYGIAEVPWALVGVALGLGMSNRAAPLVYDVSLLLLGVIGFIGCLYLQAYYRAGAAHGDLLRRVLRASLVELVFILPALLRPLFFR